MSCDTLHNRCSRETRQAISAERAVWARVIWVSLIGMLASVSIFIVIHDLQEDDYWKLFLETAKDYTFELNNAAQNSFEGVSVPLSPKVPVGIAL